MSLATSRDYEPWEVASALLISIAIQLGAGVMFWVQRGAVSTLPEIDKSALVPVRVIPVADLDMAAPKLGGGKPSALPDMWQRATPSVRKAAEARVAEKAAVEAAAVSTKASEDPKDIPDRSKKVESVETAKPVASADAPPPTTSADPIAEKPQEGAQEGRVDGATDAATPTLDGSSSPSTAPPGPGCSGPECKADGALDDFQRRQYAARLVAHVKRGGFVVTGSSLPDEELRKLRVSAVIQLQGTTIVGTNMSPSGDPACDAAARAKLDAAKGTDVPPPPEDHPEFLQPSYSVTFACAK